MFDTFFSLCKALTAIIINHKNLLDMVKKQFCAIIITLIDWHTAENG